MCISTQECKEEELELKKYEILYTAYADEIRNLWQRSIFLGAFMTLAWGGYGALQLKAIENSMQSACAYSFASLGLCFVIIVLSLLWIAMAKGSKFVQKAHEKHIEKFIVNSDIAKELYCNLKDYECLSKNDNLFLYRKLLTPYRYSPSKINIALGWISEYLAVALALIHFILLFSGIKLSCNPPTAILIIVAIVCAIMGILAFIVFWKKKDYLKGSN